MPNLDRPHDPPGAAEAVVQVVRGTPTPDEIAALLGVLLTRRRATDASPEPPHSHWAASGNPARHRAFHERDGWRRTALPA